MLFFDTPRGVKFTGNIIGVWLNPHSRESGTHVRSHEEVDGLRSPEETFLNE